MNLPSMTLGAPALAALALMAACAQPQLMPAERAQLVPGQPLAAVTQNAGVRMTVQAGAWSGYPDDLSSELTPLLVTIDNRSDQPVRVRYEDFSIATGRGTHYTPLPPLRIQGSVTQTADTPVTVHPRFTHSRFYLAPWYVRHYPGLPHWAHPWTYSPVYYDTYYPRWTVRLPTRDMLEMAIPEGVIEAGGSVSGFLYFPDLDSRVRQVDFQAQLIQGRDGQRMGALQLPFVVR